MGADVRSGCGPRCGGSSGSSSASAGASMWNCGMRRSSQLGSHHARRPSTCIVAGTSTMRMIVASTSTAVARPMPSALRNDVGAQHEGAEHRHHDRRRCGDDPGRGRQPPRDRLRGITRLQPVLADPADEEHLVVHRQPEQDREHQDRDERGQRRLAVDADEPAEPAALQRVGDHAVRGADRQHVHHGSLDRDGDAAEHHEQQQERQAHHTADEQRQRGDEAVGHVERDGRPAADVHLVTGVARRPPARDRAPRRRGRRWPRPAATWWARP